MSENNKMLQAKCRQLVELHYDTLEVVMKEIEREIDGERIEGESAFDYAKKTIRHQGMKESLKLLRQKINKYSDGR